MKRVEAVYHNSNTGRFGPITNEASARIQLFWFYFLLAMTEKTKLSVFFFVVVLSCCSNNRLKHDKRFSHKHFTILTLLPLPTTAYCVLYLWANYMGPICGLLRVLTQPSELEEVILIVSKSENSCTSSIVSVFKNHFNKEKEDIYIYIYYYYFLNELK